MILAIGLLYFAVCLAIAVWAGRRTRTAGDFYLAGRGIGIWALSIAAMAATLSGFTFIGGPGLVYLRGTGALYLVLSASITGALAAWVIGRRLRLLAAVRPVMTIPDAIGARYRSPTAQGAAAVAILLAIVGYTATNLLALGLVIDAIFHTGLTPAIWIGTAVVVGYTATGGILAGIYTDLFQGAVMALASTLVFAAALASGGGLGGISRTILAHEPAFLGPWGTLSPVAALSFFLVFGLGALGQPHVLHKFYMLRDPKRLRWYPLLMTAAMLVTLLLYFGVGIAVKAAVLDGRMPAPGRADEATPAFLLHYVSPLLAGLVFSGVAAAIMSTVNSFMNVGAAAIARDLPTAFGRPVRDELRIGRIATVGLSVAAALLAVLSDQVVAFLGIFGWGLFTSTLVPALAIGMSWRGATAAGAIASIGTGIVATVTLESLVWAKAWSLPAGITASGVALILSLLVFLVVSRLTAAGTPPPDSDIALILDS